MVRLTRIRFIGLGYGQSLNATYAPQPAARTSSVCGETATVVNQDLGNQGRDSELYPYRLSIDGTLIAHCLGTYNPSLE